jgi:hypothetical protein
MVQSINNQMHIQQPSFVHKEKSSHTTTAKTASGKDHNKMETVSISNNQETAPIYTSSLSPAETADKSYEMLRRLVTNMLKEQGIDFQIATTGSSSIDISALSQEEAQELVAEDGYFGVEQTSDRIVNFALSLAGGDVEKLDEIKEGVEHGFNEALEAFGGVLPDISYDTFDLVMQKLDDWAAKAQSKEV